MKLTCVRWLDAAYEEGPYTLRQLETKVLLETGGCFIREDEETISLCLDVYPRDRPDGSFRHIAHIPKNMIVARCDVEVDLDGKESQEE